MDIKATLASVKSRKLVTVILPLWLSWVLIRIVNMAFYYNFGRQVMAEWPNEMSSPPHGEFIPTITIMLAFALVLWVLEKDIAFTKLAVAQIVLYLLLSYCAWYLVAMPLLDVPAGIIPYDRVVRSVGMAAFLKIKFYLSDRLLPLVMCGSFVLLAYKKIKPATIVLAALALLWVAERLICTYVISPMLPI